MGLQPPIYAPQGQAKVRVTTMRYGYKLVIKGGSNTAFNSVTPLGTNGVQASQTKVSVVNWYTGQGWVYSFGLNAYVHPLHNFCVSITLKRYPLGRFALARNPYGAGGKLQRYNTLLSYRYSQQRYNVYGNRFVIVPVTAPAPRPINPLHKYL